MGNHAKRAAAARALRASGLGNLYGGGPKMAAWRTLPARSLDELERKARLAVPGTVVNDC